MSVFSLNETAIAVVYHSGQGHTEVLAHAVARGIEAADARAVLFTAEAATRQLEELAGFEGIVFGSPTYMGSVSAAFKAFMEESRLVRGQWRDKLAAGFTNSASQSGDKLNTLIQMSVFAAQHGMLWVSLGLRAGNNSTQGSVADLNRLGSFLGAMAQSNADQDASSAPPQSDRDTAFQLGLRMAAIAHQLRAGRLLAQGNASVTGH
jgi:multimeric flavodoxin WrbA